VPEPEGAADGEGFAPPSRDIMGPGGVTARGGVDAVGSATGEVDALDEGLFASAIPAPTALGVATSRSVRRSMKAAPATPPSTSTPTTIPTTSPTLPRELDAGGPFAGNGTP
jgi:hypothetical protein